VSRLREARLICARAGKRKVASRGTMPNEPRGCRCPNRIMATVSLTSRCAHGIFRMPGRTLHRCSPGTRSIENLR